MAYYINPTCGVSAPTSLTVNTSSLNSNVTFATGLNGSSYNDISVSANLASNSLEVKGRAKFDSDVDIQGKLKVAGEDLASVLMKIEQRLAILKPNKELESRWEKLKELGDQYRALEADILEKEEIMRILKS